MVRALLNGSKTQTRRIFKPERMTFDADGRYSTHAMRDGEVVCTGSGPFVPNSWLHYCPYGQPGDRLWVRETWCGEIDANTSQLIYNEDGDTFKCLYRADGHHVVLDDGDGFTKTNKDGSEASPWKPSIHMPRWASRITLEIVSVRIARLHEISKADAISEGTAAHPDGPWFAYQSLWTLINGTDSWAANPWVWVVEFKVVKL